MAEHLGLYNPDLLTVTIISPLIGTHIVTGLGTGGVAVAFSTPERITAVVGVQGDSTAASNRDRTGTITISLQASSPSRTKFDVLKEAVDVPFVVQVKDGSATALTVTATNCYVKEEPEESRAAEAPEMEWVIWSGAMTKVGA